MVECIYKAKTRFKYNGRELKRGDVWEPAGLKNDKLIERNLVRLETVQSVEQTIPPDLETEHEPKPRGKRERHDPSA
jgi:hypothetical protein